jgi:hypothetical protein
MAPSNDDRIQQQLDLLTRAVLKLIEVVEGLPFGSDVAKGDLILIRHDLESIQARRYDGDGEREASS